MTQLKTMNKLTFSFDIFLVDASSKNEKEKTCAVDFKLSIAQKLLFDYFKLND